MANLTVSCTILEYGCRVDWSIIAAWVQAIGSIAAIVYAVHIANKQIRWSIINKLLESAEQVEGIKMLTENCLNEFQAGMILFRESDTFQENKNVIDGNQLNILIEYVKNVPLYHWPSAVSINLAIRLRNNLERAVEYAPKIKGLRPHNAMYTEKYVEYKRFFEDANSDTTTLIRVLEVQRKLIVDKYTKEII